LVLPPSPVPTSCPCSKSRPLDLIWPAHRSDSNWFSNRAAGDARFVGPFSVSARDSWFCRRSPPRFLTAHPVSVVSHSRPFISGPSGFWSRCPCFFGLLRMAACSGELLGFRIDPKHAPIFLDLCLCTGTHQGFLSRPWTQIPVPDFTVLRSNHGSCWRILFLRSYDRSISVTAVSHLI
jgi:hypothetical protein